MQSVLLEFQFDSIRPKHNRQFSSNKYHLFKRAFCIATHLCRAELINLNLVRRIFRVFFLFYYFHRIDRIILPLLSIRLLLSNGLRAGRWPWVPIERLVGESAETGCVCLFFFPPAHNNSTRELKMNGLGLLAISCVLHNYGLN